MKKFNAYYGYKKLNKAPLSEMQKDKIVYERYVYKENPDGTKERIPTQKIKFIKCTVI